MKLNVDAAQPMRCRKKLAAVCALLSMLSTSTAFNMQYSEALKQALANTLSKPQSSGSRLSANDVVGHHVKYIVGDKPQSAEGDADRRLVVVHGDHHHHHRLHTHAPHIVVFNDDAEWETESSTTSSTAPATTVTTTVEISDGPHYISYGYREHPVYYEEEPPVYRPPPPPRPSEVYHADVYHASIPVEPAHPGCYNADGGWGECENNDHPRPPAPPSKYLGQPPPPPPPSPPPPPPPPYPTYYQPETYSRPSAAAYFNAASPSIIYAEDEPVVPSPPYGHY